MTTLHKPNNMKNIIILFLFLALYSCNKNVEENTYSIQGKLLESSSNPIPIKNYTLSFYQKDASGLLGGISGLDAIIKTDNNGNFLFRYNPTKSYGLSGGGLNDNNISIYGMNDTTQIKDFQPIWLPVTAGVNVDLDIIFQYKKIEKLIRTVRFNNPLNVGESLELISTNGSAADYKTFNGPIASGTLIVADTINNCRLNFFNLKDKVYRLSLTLKKPQYQKDTSYILNNIDENLRVVEIVY